MSLLWFVGGIVVGFAGGIMVALYLRTRWAKILKETREELDKVRAKVG